MEKHLAQMNIGRLLYDKDAAEIAEFMENLDRVNRIAERTDGFIWRLKDDTGNGATEIVVTEDPHVIINISVWRDVGSLEHFVWNTLHHKFYMKKGQWFERHSAPSLVMWFVDPGTEPTVNDALVKLSHLRTHGPTEDAFGWESLGQAKLWRERRCA